MFINFTKKTGNKRLKTLTFINRKEKLDQRSSQVVKLKISKFQKHIFLFSFAAKNERNQFLISELDP